MAVTDVLELKLYVGNINNTNHRFAFMTDEKIKLCKKIELGLSLSKIAKDLNVSRMTIYRIKRGLNEKS